MKTDVDNGATMRYIHTSQPQHGSDDIIKAGIAIAIPMTKYIKAIIRQ
mgnify:CR=1 FL=1